MENHEMMRSAGYPDTYNYGVRPLVSSVVADMDDMSVNYPTQGMYDNILDRVYDDVVRMYPEDFENKESTTEQFTPPFRRRRLLRDLLGVLVLFELLDRRRHRY